jgi:regulatory protein
MIKKTISPEDALQRLETLCVRAEHCRYELLEKLRKWGIFGSEAEKVLDSLGQRRFYDDARFASAFTRDKLLYNHWGRLKIMLGLKAKRIDSGIIADALNEIDAEEYESIASEFLTAKARSIKEGFTYEGRTKLYRAGMGRGFESQIVARLVKLPSTWQLADNQN